MKNKDFRVHDTTEEFVKKPAKLVPAKKSGKERREIYRSLTDDDDEELYERPVKHESVLDYMDD